jgi:hypothetical protein
LYAGLFMNVKFHLILKRKIFGGSSTAIDKVYYINNCIFIIGYSPLLVYFIANYHLFPMSDYVGKIGCGYFVLFLDQFIRVYSHILPVTIVVVRYLFVLHSDKMKEIGTEKVVNMLIIFSFVGPALSVALTRYPIFDFMHGPYNHCIGRFEVYFTPKHLDPITPGK